MIDTHCHLTYDGLHERIDDVMQGAADAGVDRMISVGTTPDDALKAVALAERRDNVFATVGLHPHYSAQWPDLATLVQAIQRLSAHPRVVAIGEMGLDRHYPDPPIDDQKRAFAAQLETVKSLPSEPSSSEPGRVGPVLPIIIHNREATDETVGMIRDSGLPGDRFVFHCFTGKRDELDAVLDLGAMVSFTGIVTFKNARDLADCAARVPADRIMVETDSPYLTPEPHRKVRPNEPRYVPYVARFLAERRGVPEAEFVKQVDANAERFFGLV